MELRGGRAEKGFLFLYELMRGDVSFKLTANDSGHALGCMLVRALPSADTQSKGFLMSILRVMMHNPQLARHLPRFEDDRKVKISLMFRGQEVMTKLLERITEVIKDHEGRGALRWPEHSFSLFEADPTLRLPYAVAAYLQGGVATSVLPATYRCWLALRPGVPATKQRVRAGSFVSEAELSALGRIPMQVDKLSAMIVMRTRSERGLKPISPSLPFQLNAHSCLRSNLASTLLARCV